ncbi:unnamed protein product [Polarella glacialis]|uniref:Target of rapamycin complex subunit LST8 n=1 Tax=Polarella glacialis TaxID=89957 RepID=A0A813EQ69_POLGL|nr:unnamed protein product [Polarella glacialis]
MSLVMYAVASPSGELAPSMAVVLTASYDGMATLWSASTGSKIQAFKGSEGGLYSAVFSPDLRYVLTASADGAACLWCCETGGVKWLLPGHGDSYMRSARKPGLHLTVQPSPQMLRTLSRHQRTVPFEFGRSCLMEAGVITSSASLLFLLFLQLLLLLSCCIITLPVLLSLRIEITKASQLREFCLG